MIKYPWYTKYGIGHAAITLVIILVSSLLINNLVATLLGSISVGYWTWRETQGPDRNNSIVKILFANWDRAMDWISPLLVLILWIVMVIVA